MHFEPLYACRRNYCGFCGVEISSEKYLTVRTKDMSISHEPKFVSFCDTHAPKYQELCERMETWKNQERAKFEQALVEEGPKMWKVIEAEVFGTKRPESPSAPPPPRRKRAGEIPNPAGLN